MRLIALVARSYPRPLVVVLLSLVFATAARAQETAPVQDTTATANLKPTPVGAIVVLSLVDGSTLQGRVLEVTATTIRFQSAIGETAIPRSAVREVHVADEGRLHDGQVWPEDPSRTRLFFAPTGRTLRKGEGYFADAYVFFPSVQFGVTDALTMGGGLSVIPGLGLDEQLYYLTPKLGVVSGPNLNISVGALVAGAPRVWDNGPAGIAYGVATFGGEEQNVTTGAGFAFSGADANHSALLMVGGSSRVSRSVALISENYLYTGTSSSVLSGGVRFIGDKLSVDAAIFVSPSNLSFPLPYVAFIYKF